MKSVLVRMGVKIRNVAPDQVMESVGYLAGVPGFEKGKYYSSRKQKKNTPDHRADAGNEGLYQPAY